MISKIDALSQWPDENYSLHSVPHPIRLPKRRQIDKWSIITDDSQSLHLRPVSEWDRPRAFHIPTELESLRSDDDVFQRASAKVGYKIQTDRKVLGGAPCVAGTRIPVYAILELIEAGYSQKKILKSFPSLRPEDLEAALRFSVIVMER